MGAIRLETAIKAMALLVVAAFGGGPATGQTIEAADSSAHRFRLPSIDGGEIDLSAYAGRPLLVVNTASHCGFTHQYEGLQGLWTDFRDQGLVVIGAPSDTFNQEMDDEADVAAFCEVAFSVDFPLTAIIEVRGRDAHPLFAWLAHQSRAPSWNFTKYLIDADGRLVARYDSEVEPAAIARDVERLLTGDG